MFQITKNHNFYNFYKNLIICHNQMNIVNVININKNVRACAYIDSFE